MQVSDRATSALYDLSARPRPSRGFGQAVVEGLRQSSAEPEQKRPSPPVAQVVEGEWLRRVTAAASRGPAQGAGSADSQAAARGAALYRSLANFEAEADDRPRGSRLDVYA